MKRTLPNWFLTLLSAALFLVCLETALALFWPHKVVSHPYHEQYHTLLGWVNKPDVSGSVHITRSLSFRRTHNGNGLRSLRETQYEKPEGVKRVLLLGDSFFWGFGVNDEDVVTEILQRKTGGNIEIINGSVTGYGTDQELLWLMEEGFKYRPDVVVLGLFPTNDIDEISRSVMYSYPKPYFSLEGIRLSLHNVPVPDTRETRRKSFESPDTLFGKLKMFLRHHTHTYPFLAGRLNSSRVLREVFLAIGIAEEFTTALPGIMEYQLQPDRVQDLADALLLDINRRCTESGIRFLLVHISRREQGSGGMEEIVYGMSPRAWNDQVSAYLGPFTAKSRIAFLDLLPVVRSREDNGEVLYNRRADDHHWTPRGHEVAAEEILKWLQQNGIVSGR